MKQVKKKENVDDEKNVSVCFFYQLVARGLRMWL